MAGDSQALLAEFARQDLALRLGVDVEDLRIAHVLPTLFGDGCLGYAPDNARCAQLLRAEPGALVGIAVDGRIELYSVTNNQVTWHDQENGQTNVDIDEDLVDVQRQLREDLADRLGVDVDDVGIGSFRLVTWPDGCLGVIRIDTTCIAALTDGYIAMLTGPDGKAYRYHGGDESFVAVDFEEYVVGLQDPVVGARLEDQMRADLANRLGVDEADVTIAEIRPATWSDNCLGIIRIDALCLRGDVEGFLAFLKAPDGELYRYHGGNGTFIAVDFEEGIAGVHDPVK
jgi:hypothetical protein